MVFWILLIKYEIAERRKNGEVFDKSEVVNMDKVGELMQVTNKTRDKEVIELLQEDHTSNTVGEIIDLPSIEK